MSTENNINVNNNLVVSDLEFVNELEKLDLSASDYKTEILKRLESTLDKLSYDDKLKTVCRLTDIVMIDDKIKIRELFLKNLEY
jgi:hypothetical protein